ncbi:prophage tail fiber N-terminal domain-containing protein [Escherichia coli]|uniref:prophage tail fiber N-terminal domain-containing protein n=2 Tax=Escherichia coli TaxID=562 RepID=UPI0020BD811B|nr:prophage tail fiber N-terminal domain-containing protein [Escherichia coli]
MEGFPPSHAGTITVYEDSQPGTLNDFLGAMTEDDARPEALRRFELMVEEVARNASAVAQNTAAAKKSASDASTSASEAATYATDAADSARAASTSAGQAASSAQSASSSAGTASTKATEASKSAAAAESSKSAAATSAGAAKTSETNAAASQKSAATSASTATTKASEAATSARDAAASKEAAKSSETSAASSASSAASSATAAGNSAKAAKTSETNADNSAQAAANSATAAKKSETNAKNSEAAAKSSETNAKASETNAKSSETNAAKSAADALNYRNQAQGIVGTNIGLGSSPRDCSDISGNPSGYIGFMRIMENATGFPSIASGEGNLTGFISQVDGSPAYTGIFQGWNTRSIYTYRWLTSIGPQWTRHARKDEVSRLFQNESTTRIYGPTNDRFFEIHTNGSWGVYDSSSGQWSPLGLAQGGTGGRTIEQARANLRVMYEQKAGLANTDLNTLTGEYSGFYQQPASAYATEELNYPIGLAGALIVLQTRANTASSCVQVYYPYNNPGITYRRIYEGGSGTWSEWKRDVSTERVEEGKETTYVYSTYSSGAPRLQVSKSGLWGCHNGTGWLPLAVGQGGTGATTVEDARNNLSLGESSAVKFKNLTLTEALDTTLGLLTKTGRDWNTQHTDNINKFIPIAGSTNGPAGSMVLGGIHVQFSKNYAVQFGGRNSGFWGRTIENGTTQEWKKLLTVDDLNSSTDLAVRSLTTSNPLKSGGGRIDVLGSTSDYSKMDCFVRGFDSTGNSLAWALGSSVGVSKMLSLKNFFSGAEILLNGNDGAVQLKTGAVNGAKAQALTINKDEVNSTVDLTLTKQTGTGNRFVLQNLGNTELPFAVKVWGSGDRQNVFEVGTSAAYLFYAQKTSSGQLFDVNGAINCTTLNQLSDRELKDNIQIISDATEAIRKMNGYTYTLKENGLPYAGVIAQEAMEAIPEAVGSFTHYGKELQGPTVDGNELREETRYLNVDYAAVTGLLVQVARETDDRVTALEEENAELKQRLSAIEAALASK